jgi:hypothetical protein
MFYMMVLLKIPILMMLGLVRWAIKATPVEEDDSGNGNGDGGLERPETPSRPRGRGPHGEPIPPSPERVRRPAKRQRTRAL